MDGGEEGRMTLDLDALEALEKKATPGPWVAGIEGRFIHFPESYHATEYDYVMCALVRNALPELIRLARIGRMWMQSCAR